MTFLLPALFVLIWASGFIIARAVAPYADPNLFLAARFVLAAAILAVSARWIGAAWPSRRTVPRQLVIGALVGGGYMCGTYWAVAHGLPAGIIALLVGLQPLLTAPVAAILFREPVGARGLLGLALGVAGVVLAVAPRLGPGTADRLAPLAVLAGIAALLSITLGTLAQRHATVSGSDLRTAAAVQNMGAALVAFVLVLLLGESRWDPHPVLWLSLVYAALILSSLGSTLLVWFVRSGGATSATALMFLSPPVTALLAFALFRETLSPVQVVGFALSASGVALLRGRRREPAR
jgi:drug/metabolite transporter (DMT)-like permease